MPGGGEIKSINLVPSGGGSPSTGSRASPSSATSSCSPSLLDPRVAQSAQCHAMILQHGLGSLERVCSRSGSSNASSASAASAQKADGTLLSARPCVANPSHSAPAENSSWCPSAAQWVGHPEACAVSVSTRICAHQYKVSATQGSLSVSMSGHDPKALNLQVSSCTSGEVPEEPGDFRP